MVVHPLDEAAAAFIDKTLERLARDLGTDAVTPAFAELFRRWPRHRFVDRYTSANHVNWYDVGRGQAVPHLQRIYNAGPITVVPDTGASEPVALSHVPAPSTIVRTLQMLRPQPGERVLELGSGSGWLLAMLADAVGPAGRVVGIEILPEIADRTRARLASMGIKNVEVVAGDGAVALPQGPPFDRVVISATIDDLPRTVFEVASESAQLVAPVLLPGAAIRNYAWTRRGAVFHAAASVSSSAVPIRGRLTCSVTHQVDVQSTPFADLLSTVPVGEVHCLGSDTTSDQRLFLATDFATFLGIRWGRAWTWQAPPGPDGQSMWMMALYDRRSASVAVFGERGFIGYGGKTALEKAAEAWREWLAFSRPPPRKFMLDIYPAEAKPAASSTCWVHQRRDSVFVWRLR